METEGRAIVFVTALAAIISYLIGSFVAVSRFQKDTYDCTVKCPDMAHSIQVNQVCYCEVR
jgi:hypothetical protein